MARIPTPTDAPAPGPVLVNREGTWLTGKLLRWNTFETSLGPPGPWAYVEYNDADHRLWAGWVEPHEVRATQPDKV